MRRREDSNSNPLRNWKVAVGASIFHVNVLTLLLRQSFCNSPLKTFWNISEHRPSRTAWNTGIFFLGNPKPSSEVVHRFSRGASPQSQGSSVEGMVFVALKRSDRMIWE